VTVFAMSYSPGLLLLFRPVDIGPRHTRITADEAELRIQMGWAFRAAVPRAHIRAVARDTAPVTGWGVHGRRGTWLVNGSSQGMVRVDIEPPTTARMLGIPVQLRTLRLSLTDPDAFLAALAPTTTP
jgi:hypothetical protein